MNYTDLANYVHSIDYRPSALGVRFGCDCGCGGDSYTAEEWDEGEQLADEAIEALTQLGVIFPEGFKMTKQGIAPLFVWSFIILVGSLASFGLIYMLISDPLSFVITAGISSYIGGLFWSLDYLSEDDYNW